MSTLTEIEEEIAKLPAEEFSELLRRLQERDPVRREQAQDAAFEAFVERGGLDASWQNALKEIDAGETTPDEICDDPDVPRATGQAS